MLHRLPRPSRALLSCLPLLFGCVGQKVTKSQPRGLPIDGVRFAGHAKLVTPGDTLLDVRVRAVNTGGSIRTLEFGNCSMYVSVSSVGLTPAREWQYAVWAKSRRVSCLEYQATRDIAPGDSVSPSDYRRQLPIRVILGDSLPAGRYRVTTRVAANGRFSEPLVVGELDLRAPGSRPMTADGNDDRSIPGAAP